ncbi:MAG: dienelactone hydrolase family protein [Bacteroidota bacterium]|nr:dienelactone hydrolase family protein [Bacteroidota bacterium]
MNRFLFLLLAFGLTACTPSSEESMADADPRVAYAPTSDTEMPPAITGNGGELEGTTVNYFDADPATTGYLAVPEGEGPFPSLIIIHEWNGLVDRVRQVADDFAAEGYVTLAVDLYSGQTGSNRNENIELMSAASGDMETVVANLDAAVAFLKQRDDVTGKVGAMGWCFGGGIALSYGLDGEQHEATAIFYGRLIDDPERLQHINHEVYGTFARLDQGPAPEQVEALEATLNEIGIENDLHIYDEVGHGFWLRIDQDPETRSEPGQDAWNRLKAYLDRTLRS